MRDRFDRAWFFCLAWIWDNRDIMDRLRRYMVNDLKMKITPDMDVEETAIKAMKAMHRAYEVVADALNVATGHPEDVKAKPPPTPQGFKVEDKR